ncbi:hypothetical protein ACFY0B_43050 [Streptomyces sp. NPDC001797]|uniref:hypothetical protein n=1 Tax=Streptomyces sp. NPDC001797 TaxID=3364610 RepID=UPI0036C233D1
MKALVINCTLKKSPEPSLRAVDLATAPGAVTDAGEGDEWPGNRPVAHDRVAGVVVTGNEDGAHHVISEISGALADIGYPIPGQAWTYWHLGPGPGPDCLPDYLEEPKGRGWAHSTGRTVADNLVGVARDLTAQPLRVSG